MTETKSKLIKFPKKAWCIISGPHLKGELTAASLHIQTLLMVFSASIKSCFRASNPTMKIFFYNKNYIFTIINHNIQVT